MLRGEKGKPKWGRDSLAGRLKSRIPQVLHPNAENWSRRLFSDMTLRCYNTVGKSGEKWGNFGAKVVVLG